MLSTLSRLLKKVAALYSRMRRAVYTFLSKSRFAFMFEILIALCALSGLVFLFVFIGLRFHVFNVKGAIDDRNAFFKDTPAGTVNDIDQGLRQCMVSVRSKVFPTLTFAWISSPEWNTLSYALVKDKDVIRKAAYDAGISPRVLVSVVISEQLRFFTSDRESYKKFFEPLKILGSLSQFSLGVSGIKPDTAKAIEQHLQDPTSPFYISKAYEHILDMDPSTITVASVTPVATSSSGTSSISDIVNPVSVLDSVRYDRLTDSHNHYYAYLYTALYIREVEEQWKRSGFDISNRPEILATIFNLGFGKSVPSADPLVAGSLITVGGETYTFGRLSYEFYYSGELADIFGF